VYDMPFIGHAPLLTRSELIELGYDPAIINGLPAGDDLMQTSQDRVSRLERNNGLPEQYAESDDKSTERLRYYHCYLRIDEDQDGIAELRRICKVGKTLLDDEPVDHIPMCAWTPKVMPHEP